MTKATEVKTMHPKKKAYLRINEPNRNEQKEAAQGLALSQEGVATDQTRDQVIQVGLRRDHARDQTNVTVTIVTPLANIWIIGILVLGRVGAVNTTLTGMEEKDPDGIVIQNRGVKITTKARVVDRLMTHKWYHTVPLDEPYLTTTVCHMT